ncbi:MAG: hypothetical protein ACTSU0_11200, partial [Alphaproteobacteria bacterium]
STDPRPGGDKHGRGPAGPGGARVVERGQRRRRQVPGPGALRCGRGCALMLAVMGTGPSATVMLLAAAG